MLLRYINENWYTASKVQQFFLFHYYFIHLLFIYYSSDVHTAINKNEDGFLPF